MSHRFAAPPIAIGLLILSGMFMTFAWRGHLRFREALRIKAFQEIATLRVSGAPPASEAAPESRGGIHFARRGIAVHLP
jgi:hypothetical protein